MPASAESIRLDKWLWQARFCRSRSIAAAVVARGGVRVNTVRVTKAATRLKVGDGLTLAHGGTVRAVRILELGTRRGPAEEARRLYSDLQEAPPGPAGLEPNKQPDT